MLILYQQVEKEQQKLFFVENHPENFLTFEFEPADEEIEADFEVGVKFFTEIINKEDGSKNKMLAREAKFTITLEQVIADAAYALIMFSVHVQVNKVLFLFQLKHYYYVEPEPEPVVEEPEQLELPEVTAERERASQQEALKVNIEKARDQAETVRRLAVPIKPKQMSKL